MGAFFAGVWYNNDNDFAEGVRGMPSYFTYDMAMGPMTFGESDGCLTVLQFGAVTLPGEQRETPLILEARRQLEEYFALERHQFSLPLCPAGTPFQQKVWAALRQIPYGTTVSYKELAIAIGNEKACRAVGMANHRNPIGIIVPCHRVVGANGDLTGYAAGLSRKRQLLELEQQGIGGEPYV